MTNVIEVIKGPPNVIEVVQAGGPPGPQGPAGPPGPAGPAGCAYTQVWTSTNKTTDASGSGQVGINTTVASTATQLNMNQQTSDNTDVTAVLSKVKVGDGFYVQQKTDSTRWAKYTVTATPVDNGSWWAFPVTFQDGSGTGAPNPNAAVDVAFLTSGANQADVPAGGATGQVLTKTSAADYATGWQTPAPADLSTAPLLLPATDTRNAFNGAAGRLLITGRVTGDTNPRLTVDTNGTLAWGDGTAASDVTLSRQGANTIQASGGM